MLKKFLMILIMVLSTISISAVSVEEILQALSDTTVMLERALVRIETLEGENDTLRGIIEDDLILKEDFIKRIESDQKEIDKLRGTIRSISTQLDEKERMTIGLGITYPLGGTVHIGFKPRLFPVGLFINGTITDKVSVGLGVSYSF